MKEYRVFIDISEIMNVKANTEEEAKERVIKQLEESGTIWTSRDVELNAEECND